MALLNARLFKKIPHTKLAALMVFGAVILWIAAMLFAKANYCLLISEFPDKSPVTLFSFMFWLALSLLVLTVTLLREDNNRLLVCLILITLMVHLTLVLFQENPRNTNSFCHFGGAKVIIQTGHINPERVGYHSWPGAFILGSMVKYVLNVSEENLLYYYPLFFLITMVLGLYLLAKRFSTLLKGFSSKATFIAVTFLILLAENNSLQTHFSPQSLGYVLIIFFVYAFLLRGYEKHASYTLLCILIFGTVTFTHHPSTLFAILVLIPAGLLRFLRFKNSLTEFPTFTFMMTSLVIFLAWQIYQVYQLGWLRDLIESFVAVLLRGFEEAKYFTVGLPKDPILSYLSVLRQSFFFSLGFYGFFQMLRRHEKNLFLSVILFYGLGTFLFFMFLLFFVRGMIWERVFLFGSLPISLCGAYVIRLMHKNAKRILLIITLAFLLTNTYTMYDSELPNIVPTSELLVADFVVKKVQVKVLTMEINELILFNSPDYWQSNVIPVSYIYFDPNKFTYPSEASCVIISRQIQRFLGDEEFYYLTSKMNNMNKVYSSNFTEIYEVSARD